MRYRWLDRLDGGEFRSTTGTVRDGTEVLERCLRNRGVGSESEAELFLNPRLRELTDPFDFPAMGALVRRLQRAREAGELVVLFGDYDVDGVTATAVLHEVLSRLGWQVAWYLPDRMSEGYGLGREAVQRCLQIHGARLILAVDCGATAGGLVRELSGQGVEVLVLDHHQSGGDAPPPDGLLHPSTLPTPDHPARHLCSAGLAFKLAHGVVKAGRRESGASEQEFDLRPLLDLVALGTIADLVPLCGENRILAAAGLRQLGVTQRRGLRALMEVSRTAERPGVGEVAYQLAPRLNAAGRLDSACEALELLLTEDPVDADRRAERLDQWNRERQAIERRVAAEAAARVRASFDPGRDWVLVQGDAGWHLGVVGIVASRLVREFHRPSIVLGSDGMVWRGSGRSIEGFDLAGSLGECGELLERSGGHAMAAGLSVRPEKVEALRGRLNELARDRLRPEQLTPALRVDGELPLRMADSGLVRELSRLEPTGQGNPAPCFVFRGLRLVRPPRRMGREGRHVRLLVGQGTCVMDVVWWGAEDAALPQGSFDLAGQPQLNQFNGEEKVELRFLDWRLSEKVESGPG